MSISSRISDEVDVIIFFGSTWRSAWTVGTAITVVGNTPLLCPVCLASERGFLGTDDTEEGDVIVCESMGFGLLWL